MLLILLSNLDDGILMDNGVFDGGDGGY